MSFFGCSVTSRVIAVGWDGWVWVGGLLWVVSALFLAAAAAAYVHRMEMMMGCEWAETDKGGSCCWLLAAAAAAAAGCCTAPAPVACSYSCCCCCCFCSLLHKSQSASVGGGSSV
ncbi:hypothetical protein BZA77DRAFT_172234 [Pyronema omphalodes]|nr:hypothetical protein BZA77DRAFT_172234 [Pyronema omphalodes]